MNIEEGKQEFLKVLKPNIRVAYIKGALDQELMEKIKYAERNFIDDWILSHKKGEQ